MNIFQQGAKKTSSSTKSKKRVSKAPEERASEISSISSQKPSETGMSSSVQRDHIVGRGDWFVRQESLDKLRSQATCQVVDSCTKCDATSRDLNATRQLLRDKERLLQAAEASNTMQCKTISELQQQLREARAHKNFFNAARSAVDNVLTCGICWDEFDDGNPPLTVYAFAAIVPLAWTHLIITTAFHAVIRYVLNAHFGGKMRGEDPVSNAVLS
ncbi:hypothetical protein AAF712_016031 [Marasmius tenuissimus]|uniref:Uncharacterized protein n=1 Tax=Marasmius tenuissimus TaxID=585030 RepID=A0ABR2Z7Y0_9AGAR